MRERREDAAEMVEVEEAGPRARAGSDGRLGNPRSRVPGEVSRDRLGGAQRVVGRSVCGALETIQLRPEGGIQQDGGARVRGLRPGPCRSPTSPLRKSYD